MKKLFIFDIDGTILDTSQGIVSSVNFALHENQLVLPNDVSTLSFIGPPIQKRIKEIFPSMSNEKVSIFCRSFRENYKNHDLLKASPYSGIMDIFYLISKSNSSCSIASYKRDDYAFSIVDHFGFTKFTKNIHGQDFAGTMDKSDIINLCLVEANVSPENAIMIGDSINDYDGAIGSKVSFIPVTYGFGFDPSSSFEKLNVIGVANSVMDLRKLIGGLL